MTDEWSGGDCTKNTSVNIVLSDVHDWHAQTLTTNAKVYSNSQDKFRQLRYVLSRSKVYNLAEDWLTKVKR